MRAPTILQVLPALESGGVERGTVEMAQAIAAAGGTALVASAGGRMVSQLGRVGAEHLSLPLLTRDPLNIWLNAGKLARVIRDRQVSLVHARSRAPAWSAWIAARRQGVPLITTWHGMYGDSPAIKRFYNRVMARGDRVIAISAYVANHLVRRYRISPDRIRLIPRGVDTAVFDPDLVTGDRVHRLGQAWRLPAGAPVVMLPARLTRWKGGLMLLEAFARLARSDAFCVLVGAEQGGGFSGQLQARAQALGLTARLRLVGQCDDMPAALLLADVVVCPSTRPEAFGRSVIEAQAMARAVVASDHGGAAETVQGTGFLVPPSDPAALAAAIDAALAMEAEARRALGDAARRAVLANYTTAAMQAATLAVYQEVLG